MCGLILLSGPCAVERLEHSLNCLKHRGPDEQEKIYLANFSIGFTRLAITDTTSKGKQPFHFGEFISAVNGEIFNHNQLKNQFKLETSSSSDCHIIPMLFSVLGSDFLNYLDGFFAGIIYNQKSNELFTVRDYMGKKPLFIGRSATETFITSELKAIPSLKSFTEIPSGLCKINLKEASFSCVTKISLQPPTQPINLYHTLEQAVIKRLPDRQQPVGVFLSGGLDSSIIALLVQQYRPDAQFYCLASPHNSADLLHTTKLAQYLNIKNLNIIDLPTEEEVAQLIPKLVTALESTNPSIISNGLCTWLVAEAAHKDGLKVVLSGEGADELFCGYHSFQRDDNWQATRIELMENMRFTELRRIDLACMAHSIESRCPFLDKAVISIANSLQYDDHYGIVNNTQYNKMILRKTFAHKLPNEITWRKKESFDVGSGIRAMVVKELRKHSSSERSQLKKIWQTVRPYTFEDDALIDEAFFDAYPVFDSLIDHRGAKHK